MAVKKSRYSSMNRPLVVLLALIGLVYFSNVEHKLDFSTPKSNAVTVMKTNSFFSSSFSVKNYFMGDKNIHRNSDEGSSQMRILATDDHAVTDDHATDDHGDAVHASEPNLFGALDTIEPEIGTAMIMIIVCGVLAIEYIFETINKLTHDTPFHEMVKGIENELMVVGTVAFIFKIIVSTSTFLTHDYFFALEFADLLVPLFAFSNCFIGLLLIFVLMRQIDNWSKAYHLKLDEMLVEYYDSLHFFKKFPFYRYYWANISRVVPEIEFRILHTLFCETFRIHRDAFAFDEYVEKVFEKSVFEIIELHIHSWIIFCILILLNLGRLNNSIYFYDCGEEDYECKELNSIWIFSIFSIGVWLTTFITAAVSRYYTFSIFTQRGIQSWEYFPEYLQYMEENADDENGYHKLDEESLKRTLNERKIHQTKSGSRKHTVFGTLAAAPHLIVGHLATSGKRNAASHSPSRKEDYGSDDELAEKDEINVQKQNTQQKSFTDLNAAMVAPETFNESKNNNESDTHAAEATETSANDDSLPIKNEEDEQVKLVEKAKVPFPKNNKVHVLDVEQGSNVDDKAQKSSPLAKHIATITKTFSMRSSPENISFVDKKAEHLASIFLFSWPNLFFTVCDNMIVIVSLDLAFWLLNFSNSVDSAKWTILAFLPIFFSIINYIYIVKASSLLKAVYQVDQDVVLEVIEDAESIRLLGDTLKTQVFSKLKNLEDPINELKEVFISIDSNKNGFLSRLEFVLFMDTLDIHFSQKKWNRIYQEIDRNFDNEISFEEFFLFLYPDHDTAKAYEQRRLKKLKNRVKKRSDEIKKENDLMGKKAVSFIPLSELSNNSRDSSKQGTDINAVDDRKKYFDSRLDE